MMFTELHEGSTPLLRNFMSEQVFSFPILAFAPLGGFTDLLLKKGSDGDIFIQPRPMDADPVANESPVSSLMRRGISKARKPIKGNTDFSAIE